MRLFSCLLLASSLACATMREAPPAPRPAEDAGPVTLRFAWPRDLVLDVTNTKETTLDALGGGSTQDRETTRYRLASEQGTDGELRLQRRDVVVDEEAERIEQELARLPQPVLVVDAQGAALRVEGIEAHLESLAERMDEPGLLHPQAMRQMEQALALPLIGHWRAVVGDWLGKTYVVGAEQVDTDPEVAQPAPGQAIRTRVSTRLEAGVTCGQGAPAARCVRLLVRSEALESELPQVMEAMGQKLGMPISNLRIASETELVTDPQTLVPVSLSRTKSFAFETTGEDGAVRRGGELKRDRYTYVLATAASP